MRGNFIQKQDFFLMQKHFQSLYIKLTLEIYFEQLENGMRGNSLESQCLRLCISIAGGTGLIPGWGYRIPQAMQCSQIKRKKENGMRVQSIGF